MTEKDWRSKPRIKSRIYAEPMKTGIGFNVTDKQKEIISRAAEKAGLGLSEYCRMKVLEGEKNARKKKPKSKN